MFMAPKGRDEISVALQRARLPREKAAKVLAAIDCVFADPEKAEAILDQLIAKIKVAPSIPRERHTAKPHVTEPAAV